MNKAYWLGLAGRIADFATPFQWIKRTIRANRLEKEMLRHRLKMIEQGQEEVIRNQVLLMNQLKKLEDGLKMIHEIGIEPGPTSSNNLKVD